MFGSRKFSIILHHIATTNPFDLLGNDENDDPNLLLAAQQEKIATAVAKNGSALATVAAQPAKSQVHLPPTQLPNSATVAGPLDENVASRGYNSPKVQSPAHSSRQNFVAFPSLSIFLKPFLTHDIVEIIDGCIPMIIKPISIWETMYYAAEY
ncbi:hypothetical protein Ancab_016182 [Ancistrocladus abbreviatus]